MIKLNPREREKMRRILDQPVPSRDEMAQVVMTFTTFQGQRFDYPKMLAYANRHAVQFVDLYNKIVRLHKKGQLL